ncbi:TonB-dependent receptor [Ramlibacter sp. AN1015]|uniref:TonB-dependent receptor family protein n=1 Tax=Ramlibacter sp. AN1015 TaxID=3133428 RepID=UPI0030C0005A
MDTRLAPPRRRHAPAPRCTAGALLLRLLVLLSATGPAWAQVRSTEATLRPITVTATPGVEQSAFDAPASIDVIEGAVLRGQAQLQVNLSEVLARVPGLVVQNRQNYAQDLQISSRGFGARSTFGVRGIRLYADGIPAAGPDGQGQVSHFDLASAERIEVLRGPFSVLYGNASGGVISIFTAEGGPDTVAELSGALGPWDTRRATTQLSGQEGRLRYRVSATRFETDGWRMHSAARREGFNAKLNYALAADTDLTLIANDLSLRAQDPLGLTRAQWEEDPRQAQPAALLFDTRKTVDQLQLGAVLAHRIDARRRLQFTAYAGERETLQFQAIPVAVQRAPSQPGGVIDLTRRYQGLDARWIHQGRSPAGPVTVTAGLALEATRDLRRGWENFVAGGDLGVRGDLRRDEVNRAVSIAPYAQGQWVLGERWSALAGLRHTRVRFESDDRYVRPGNADDSGSVRYAATTPAAGLVFHAHESLNVYAAYGRGFETPTLNELAYQGNGAAGLNTGLRPAISRQWELGVKALDAADERWQLSAAVFQARTRDEIVVLANTGGRASFQNAPGTRRQGFELAGSGRWGAGWSALLSATWLDATYSDRFLTCAGTPCTAPSVPVAAGSRLPGIPRTSAYAELAWRQRAWGLETALEARHVGRVPVDDRNTDAAPGYTVLAVRARLEQVRGGWTFEQFLRIDNLADHRYAGSVIVNEGNRRNFEPAPGRSWLLGASAAYRF